MADSNMRGPTVTYVTDPELTAGEQKRIVREVIGCAHDQLLRLAFRLPDASDSEVTRLLEWYLQEIDEQGLATAMLPPLIHDRPELVARYQGTSLWLPTRRLGKFRPAATYSVHNVDEVMAAGDAGANELVYGHVFASASHPGEAGRGIASLKTIATVVGTDPTAPVITAIGGINERTIAGIGRMGVGSTAMIRAISRSPDITATLQSIRHNWLEALEAEDRPAGNLNSGTNGR